MPRVLRILNRMNLGGPVYNACYLSAYLEPEYETLLIAGEKDESEASSMHIAESLGVKPIIIPGMKRSINPLKDRKALNAIKQIIREFKPDIVHTHAAKSGALGRLAAHQCGVPHIIHTFHGHIFHSYFGSAKTKAFLQIERYLAKKSSKIIAISSIQKKELSEQFKIAPPEKFEIIPLGFDLKRFWSNQDKKRKAFRKEFKLDPKIPLIGIIGRLAPVKDHLTFVDAIIALQKQTDIDFKALIIGDGETREEIETHIISKNLQHNPFLFTSWYREVDRACAGLDIVALSSLNEGTPVSLIEAQAAGKPVVSTNVGGVEDIVQDGEQGYVVPKQDPEKLAEALLRLLADPQKALEMGEKGRAFVKKHYSVERLVSDVKQLYDSLLKA